MSIDTSRRAADEGDIAILTIHCESNQLLCATIDVEDYLRCSRYRWRLSKKGYITTSTTVGGRNGKDVCVTLTAFIARGYQSVADFEVRQNTDKRLRRVYPINGNKLDLRKSNLTDGWRKTSAARNYIKPKKTLLPVGVGYQPGQKKPYSATVHLRDHTGSIGFFSTVEEAKAAYEAALAAYEDKTWEEFAKGE